MILTALLATLALAEPQFEICDAAVAKGWHMTDDGLLLAPPNPTLGLGEVSWVVLRHMDRLLDALDEVGVHVVAVPLPLRATVFPEHVKLDEDGQATNAEQERAYRALVAHLSDKTTTIDVLALARQRQSPLYRPFDHHLTHDSGVAIGRAIGESLQADGVLDSLPKTKLVEKQESSNKRYSQLQLLSKLCPDVDSTPTRETVTVYRAADPTSAGGLFAETPPPPIVLTGNSNTDPLHGMASGIRGQTGQDVLHVGISGLFSTVGGLRRYLMSTSYADARPPVIVWEFSFLALAGVERDKMYVFSDPAHWRELVPAVWGACDATALTEATVELAPGETAKLLTPPKSVDAVGPRYYVQLDFDDAIHRTLDVDFRHGKTRDEHQIRPAIRVKPVPRVFVELSEYIDEPLTAVYLNNPTEQTQRVHGRLCHAAPAR